MQINLLKKSLLFLRCSKSDTRFVKACQNNDESDVNFIYKRLSYRHLTASDVQSQFKNRDSFTSDIL